MTPQLRAWLDTGVTIQRWNSSASMRRIERLAELIAVNAGSMRVRGWGCIGGGDGPYGRTGLDQDEAMELMSWEGFMAAVELLDPAWGLEIEQEVEAIWIAEKAKRAEQQQPEANP